MFVCISLGLSPGRQMILDGTCEDLNHNHKFFILLINYASSWLIDSTFSSPQHISNMWNFSNLLLPHSSASSSVLCHLLPQQWQHHCVLGSCCLRCAVHAVHIQAGLKRHHEAQHHQHQFNLHRPGRWLALPHQELCLGPRGPKGRSQCVHQPDDT